MLKLLQQWLLKTRMEALSLKEGDILLVERGDSPKQQLDAIMQAGRVAGLTSLNIPIVFVDNINGYKVEDIKNVLQENTSNPG